MGDFIIASTSGYFLQAFRRIGLVPDGGSTYLLPHSIGRARAMEMTLFGEKLPAEKALEWGLINRVVADDDLLSEAKAYAKKLADGPTQALALIRDLIWQAEDNDFDSQYRPKDSPSAKPEIPRTLPKASKPSYKSAQRIFVKE